MVPVDCVMAPSVLSTTEPADRVPLRLRAPPAVLVVKVNVCAPPPADDAFNVTCEAAVSVMPTLPPVLAAKVVVLVVTPVMLPLPDVSVKLVADIGCVVVILPAPVAESVTLVAVKPAAPPTVMLLPVRLKLAADVVSLTVVVAAESLTNTLPEVLAVKAADEV